MEIADGASFPPRPVPAFATARDAVEALDMARQEAEAAKGDRARMSEPPSRASRLAVSASPQSIRGLRALGDHSRLRFREVLRKELGVTDRRAKATGADS